METSSLQLFSQSLAQLCHFHLFQIVLSFIKAELLFATLMLLIHYSITVNGWSVFYFVSWCICANWPRVRAWGRSVIAFGTGECGHLPVVLSFRHGVVLFCCLNGNIHLCNYCELVDTYTENSQLGNHPWRDRICIVNYDFSIHRNRWVMQ